MMFYCRTMTSVTCGGPASNHRESALRLEIASAFRLYRVSESFLRFLDKHKSIAQCYPNGGSVLESASSFETTSGQYSVLTGCGQTFITVIQYTN